MTHTCSSCGAPIMWVRTKSNRTAPLDPGPVDSGNIVVREGLAVYLGGDMVAEPGENRYVSHFATCPNARTHRKGR